MITKDSLKQDYCTGCGACMHRCPHGAIKLSEDNEGFLYPEIDEARCEDCGICIKTCEKIRKREFHNHIPLAYAVIADDQSRLQGSSGGVFPALARHFIDEGFMVCGAEFDPNNYVRHTVVNTLEDLRPLFGSKYVQSIFHTVLPDLHDHLQDKKEILLVGTPCQIAAAKHLFAEFSDQLILCDIVCHGVPSNKILQKYISEKVGNEKIEKINFRDKQKGWNSKLIMSLKTKLKYISTPAHEDSYLKPFLSNLNLRKSCGSCIFNQIPRVGDISLADLWGVENINNKWNDNMGTSLLLINNDKGRNLINNTRHLFNLYEQFPLSKCILYNRNITLSSVHHKLRANYFKLLNQGNSTQQIMTKLFK